MKIQTTLKARKTLKLGARVAFAALLGGTVNLGCAQETTANVSAPNVAAPNVAATAVAADDWSAEHEPGTRKTLDINGVEFAFRFCPGGSVAVGPNEDKKVVDVDDYWTLETEVTCAMWKAIVGIDQSMGARVRYAGAAGAVERRNSGKIRERSRRATLRGAR